MLEAARRADAGRVILASTVWVYAATHGDVVDEETPFDLTLDRHIYASSKLAAEMFCADYANLFGRPYTVLRYGIPFGPRMRSDLVVAAFLERALRGEALRIDGDGAQERSFVYVEDLAAAHVLALAPVAENRTYNLEANEPISIRRLAETVGELVGDVEVTFGPSRPGDYRAKRVSSERARTELGWSTAVRLRGRPATHARVVPAADDRHRPRLTPRDEQAAVRSPDTAVAGRAGSRSCRRTTKSRWSRRCSTSCTRSSTSWSSSTTAPPTARAARSSAGCPATTAAASSGTTSTRECRRRTSWRSTMLRDAPGAPASSSPNDLVFTVDADGQHDLAVLDELVEITIDQGIDAMLAERDLSYHGPYKKLGNFLLSGWASLWAGNRLHDVESGYRIFRLGSLAHALDFYKGYKYSETVEVAVVMSRLGYRVRNDHVVPVPVSRSRTRLRDAVIDLAVIPVAAARVWRREPRAEDAVVRPRRRRPRRRLLGRGRAARHRPRPGHERRRRAAGRDGRRAGRRGDRAPCRPNRPPWRSSVRCSPRIAAWLVPQRPDLGSAVALVAVFTAGRGARRARDPPPASVRAAAARPRCS